MKNLNPVMTQQRNTAFHKFSATNKTFRSIMFATALACSTILVAPFAIAEQTETQVTEQTESNSAKVNINSASAAELASGLKNVGAKKAEVIVTYREEYGPFNKAEQLMEVPGIGPKLFEINKDRIAVD